AAARRARALAGEAAEAPAARRAARRARQEAARAHAIRARQSAGAARRHVHRRDARSGRGDDALEPHRRHGGRAHRADRYAERHLRIPELQVRRRVHRQHQRVPGADDRGRARPRADCVAGVGRHDLRQSRRQRRIGCSGVGRGPAREDPALDRAAAAAGQRHARHRERDRVHGRHEHLSGANQHRQDDARDAAQRVPARRRHHLGSAGVSALACVQPGGAAGMITRGEVPHPQRHSAGAQLLLRFLETLPPYRWTRARLVQWGVTGRTAVIAIPYLWLLLFFLIPFVIVLKIGFSETQIALPPYQPLFHWTQEKIVEIKLNVGNFLYLVEDSLYWRAYLNSLKIAAVSTILCLLVGYPIAYAIARASGTSRQ